jgi:hypothetical protein
LFWFSMYHLFLLLDQRFSLNTFLSNTICLFFVVSFKTHVSHPYVTVGLIILQYNFNLDFLQTNLLLKRNWLPQYALFPRVILCWISSTNTSILSTNEILFWHKHSPHVLARLGHLPVRNCKFTKYKVFD